MTKNDPNDSIEKEILDNRGVSNVEDDDVVMIKPKVGKKKRNYIEKINKLTPKNFKLRRTIIAIICIAIIGISFVISNSFAKLTNVSETDNTSSLKAGVMKLDFTKGSSAINLENAVPQTDADAILNNEEYLFTVTNTGDIANQYSIILNNKCDTKKEYKINNRTIKPDMCIPDKYIKVGLSINDSEYKIVSSNESMNNYILDTQTINKGATNKYKLKIWLDLETPNDYNSKGEKNVIYLSNINIVYKQVEETRNVNSSLDQN